MPRPLVPRRGLAAASVAVCALVVAVLGVLVHGGSTYNWFDTGVYRTISDSFGAGLLQFAVDLTTPALVVAALALVLGTALVCRRWDVAALAFVAPALCVVVSELILKPIVDRHMGSSPSLAYPSGHETGLGSFACLLVVVLLGADTTTARKIAGTTMLVLLAAVGGIGLTGLRLHYATDVIGAVGVIVVVTVGAAMAIDAVSARITRREPELAGATSRTR